MGKIGTFFPVSSMSYFQLHMYILNSQYESRQESLQIFEEFCFKVR